MLEVMATVLSTAALGLAAYVLAEVAKVMPIKEEVTYIRGRVDALYDHFLRNPSGPDQG